MEYNTTMFEALAGLQMAHGKPVPDGVRYWVDGNATDAADDADHGTRPEQPFATLDYAVGQCNANNGDVILVAPGHTETIGSAGALALDVAGITIIGLGNGSDAPTFTFNTVAGADVDVDAANITIYNLRFINTVDGCTGPFDVNAAYFSVLECEFEDDGADNTIDWFVLDANAHDFLCKNCIHKGTDTAGNDSFISVTGACANLRVINLTSNGDFAAGNIEFLDAATDIAIEGCRLENANAVDVNIEGFAGITGWISNNKCRIATDGQLTWINTPGAAALYENYGVNADGETGMLIGTVSA